MLAFNAADKAGSLQGRSRCICVSNFKLDFFVTGSQYRHVNDFIVVQGLDFNFTTVSAPTTTEVATASAWPEADVSIYRRDENGDGFLDFTLVHVDQHIPELFQFTVLTDGATGKTPEVTVPANEKFWRLVHEVGLFLQHCAALVDVLNQPLCIPAIGVTVAVPVLGSIPGTEFELPNGIQIFTFAQLGVGESCIVPFDSFLPETTTFVNSHAAFLVVVELSVKAVWTTCSIRCPNLGRS